MIVYLKALLVLGLAVMLFRFLAEMLISPWLFAGKTWAPKHTFGGDTAPFRAFRWLFKIKMDTCGCLYMDSSIGPSQPKMSSEVTVECWRKRDDGALLKYDKKKLMYGRCEGCGRYQTVMRDGTTTSDTREFWADDPEPWPDDDRIVIDESEMNTYEPVYGDPYGLSYDD